MRSALLIVFCFRFGNHRIDPLPVDFIPIFSIEHVDEVHHIGPVIPSMVQKEHSEIVRLVSDLDFAKRHVLSSGEDALDFIDFRKGGRIVLGGLEGPVGLMPDLGATR